MISVVTITFNNPDELVATLGSLEGAPGVESVVVNGGRPIPEPITLKRPPGPIIQEKDEGISDAFNKGWRISAGNAVAFLNSGDRLLDSSYYSRAEAVLSREPSVGFVYADIRFHDSDIGSFRMVPRGDNIHDLGKGMPFPHPSLVVRREIFDLVGGFSEKYRIAMDFDFVVRLLKAGHRGRYLPGEVVEMDGGGVSSTRERAGILECRESLIANGCFHGKIRSDYRKRLFRCLIRGTIKGIFGSMGIRLVKSVKRQ